MATSIEFRAHNARWAWIITVLAWLAPLIVTDTAQAQPSVWQLDEGTAHFAADYTLGSFRGSTTALSGRVSGSSVQNARGSVEVFLDSLVTGNGLRDKHMRAALETSSYPTARFTADSIQFLMPSVADSAQLFGKFSVRGVTRAVVARATVRAAKPSIAGAEVWLVDAAFPVTLAEHGIVKGISRLMGTIRVGPVVTVSISARFAATSAAETEHRRKQDTR